MSGGEQQMLAMGRALMSRPRLICMDEPTMGLAPLFVERTLDLIAEINRQGASIFMVEQNATLALSIATRGYVLQNGALVLDGPARHCSRPGGAGRLPRPAAGRNRAWRLNWPSPVISGVGCCGRGGVDGSRRMNSALEAAATKSSREGLGRHKVGAGH